MDDEMQRTQTTRQEMGPLSVAKTGEPQGDRQRVGIRWCGLIAEYGLYSLFFLLPLLYVRDLTADYFILPKLTVLRWVTIIVLVALGFRLFFRGQVSVRPTFLGLPLLAWLSVNAIAAWRGISLTHSLFGEYERYDGLLTQVNYVVLFLLMANMVDSGERLRRAVALAAAGGVLAALSGLIQLAGFPMIDSNELGQFQGRVFGTLGNPGFYAAYLVLTIPLLIALALLSAQEQRWLWVFGLLLAVAGLAFSLTRGAWLGFAASLPPLLLATGRLAQPRRLLLTILVIALLTILLAGGLATFRSSDQSGRTASSVGLVERAATVADGREGTAQFRLLVWRAAIRLIADHPVWGTGPNTFQAASGRYITIELASQVGEEEDTDRVHNGYLQVAIDTGTVGLLVYLLVLGTFGYHLARGIRAITGRERVLLAGLGAAWVGYLVQDFFLFGVVPTAGLWWLLMGATAGYINTLERGKTWRVQLPDNDWLKMASLLAALLAGLWLLWSSASPLLANVRIRQAEDALAAGDVARALAGCKAAVELSPEQQRYRELCSDVLLQVARRTSGMQMGRIYLDQSLLQINEAIARNPQYATLYYERAGVYEAYGPLGQDKAYEDYLRAQELRPYDYAVAVSGAQFMTRINRPAEAARMARTALEIHPRDAKAAGLLVQNLVSLSEPQDAVAVMRPVVAANPQSAQAHYWMGQALEANGDAGMAREEYRQALRIDPGHREAKKALDRLGE